MYFIAQSLYVNLIYSQLLDLDRGPEKNRALEPSIPLRRPWSHDDADVLESNISFWILGLCPLNTP